MTCDISDIIAGNIKKYRTLNHLTQEQMAAHLSLDTQYYAQLERNERKFTLDKICTVCELFNIEIDKIIELPALPTDSPETDYIIENVSSKIATLTLNQLKILEKYIDEILPLQK